MQETPRKDSDTKERILDLAEAAVLEKGFAATVIGVATGWPSWLTEPTANTSPAKDACRIYSRTALAQAVVTLVVVPPRAAWTQWRPRAF